MADSKGNRSSFKVSLVVYVLFYNVCRLIDMIFEGEKLFGGGICLL